MSREKFSKRIKIVRNVSSPIPQIQLQLLGDSMIKKKATSREELSDAQQQLWMVQVKTEPSAHFTILKKSQLKIKFVEYRLNHYDSLIYTDSADCPGL